jgi:alpha-glucosidase
LSSELKQKNIHLVPIIDAAIKIEDGYDVYEEGVANNYFCKNEDGSNFVAGVWPGKVHFPDVLNEKAREWFGNQYKTLTDLGIDGFWNDMNEPAIFYSQENLDFVLDKVAGYRGTNLDITTYFEMLYSVIGLMNNPDDYKRFYHQMTLHGVDTQIRHDLVHNLYGYFMTRAASEAFDRIEPNKRLLLFSRSSYIGMHRYGGLWTGDNYSWWSHMQLLLHQLPSINMCGFIYTGADLGGFQDNATEDLMLRWTALALFTPLMRNHSDTRSEYQELYRFGHQDTFKNLLKIRYAFIPYLYSECIKATLSNDIVYTPLAFEWPEDKIAVDIEDQLLIGESVMIAPVMEQNKKGRYVYLPEEMMEVRMKSDIDYNTKILPAGIHYLPIDLDTVVFFIRKNHAIILGKGVSNTAQINPKDFVTLGFAPNDCKNEVSYTCYFDDGYSKDYENPDHLLCYKL